MGVFVEEGERGKGFFIEIKKDLEKLGVHVILKINIFTYLPTTVSYTCTTFMYTCKNKNFVCTCTLRGTNVRLFAKLYQYPCHPYMYTIHFLKF